MEHQDQLCAAYERVKLEEEELRTERWRELLMRHTLRESGVTYDLLQLAELGLQDLITQAADGSDQLSRELPPLVQLGFPMGLRGLGWRLLLDVSVRRHKGHYQLLVAQLGGLADVQELSTEDIKAHLQAASAAAAAAGEQPTAWHEQGAVWLQQIEKDLPRTFAGHPAMTGPGRPALRRVLAAYTMLDSVVGYCQGMNYLAAVLLMFMPEEDAFWCLVIVVEQVLTGYFSPDMMATKVDQRVFQQLVARQLPAVAAHMEAVGADIACVFAQWFLCAFVNSLPLDTCLRVWDVLFFHKSSAVLFQVGLALVDMYSSALLAATDVLEAFQVVQGMAALTHDATRLLALALVKYSTLDDHQLGVLRQQARAQVLREEELAEASRAGRLAGGDQTAPPDSRISVVKKFLARLDKRLDGAVGALAASGPGGRATPETPVPGGSDAEDGGNGTSAPAPAPAAHSAPASAGRVGNHTIPDASDAPLLRPGAHRPTTSGPGGGAPAGAPPPSSSHELISLDDPEGGSYVPPTPVPLFPEAKDFISLSPCESSAVPDLDDLLRLNSQRLGSGQERNISRAGRAVSATALPLSVLGLEEGPEEEYGSDAEGAGPAGVGRSNGGALAPDGGLTPPAPAVERNSRIQALDAMLWSEVPPQSDAGRGSGPTAGLLPAAVSAPAALAVAMAEPKPSPLIASHPLTAPSPAQAASASQPSTPPPPPGPTVVPPSYKPPTPPPLSPAMAHALQIALRHTDAPSGPVAGGGPAAARAPTSGVIPWASSHGSGASRVGVGAASGGDAMGSATSAASVGLSSVPTEEMDGLHVTGGALHPSRASPASAAAHGGASTCSHGYSELKDDWVDLHVGGEDLTHHQLGNASAVSAPPARPGSVPSPSRRTSPASYGGGGAFGRGVLAAGVAAHAAPGGPGGAVHHLAPSSGGGAVLLQPLGHSLPAPHTQRAEPLAAVLSLGGLGSSGSGSGTAARDSALFKTISNGWVDGGLTLHPTTRGLRSSGDCVGLSYDAQHSPSQGPPQDLSAPSTRTFASSFLSMRDLPAPMDSKGDSTVNGSGAQGLLRACRAAAGLPATAQAPSATSVQRVCEREGLAATLATGAALSVRYAALKPTSAPALSGPAAGLPALPDLPDLPSPSTSHRTLLLGLQSLLQDVQGQLTALSVIASPAPDQGPLDSAAAQHAARAASTLALAARQVQAGLDDMRSAEAGGVRSVALSISGASEGLATADDPPLLAAYHALAGEACDKLEAMAALVAEQEALMAALRDRVAALSHRLADQDAYVGSLQAAVCELQAYGMKSSGGGGGALATMHRGGADAGHHSGEGQPGRLLGALQKLRDRSRPASPPLGAGHGGSFTTGASTRPSDHHSPLLSGSGGAPSGWLGLQAPTDTGSPAAHGGAAGTGGWYGVPSHVLQEQGPGVAGGQSYALQGMSSGPSNLSGGYGMGVVGRSDDSASFREEGRVSRWFNRLIKKEDGGEG